MNNFNFLKNVEIAKVEETPKAKVGKVAQERNPTNGASLRLFKDGSMYPSVELVAKYNLEYNKEKTGSGFDIFSSTNWNQYPKDQENVVFITATAKSNARVDLFSIARETNGELSSVLTQGSKTFGLELIPMLESTYNTTLFANAKYVDLVIVEDVAITQDIVYVPKMVMKGEHKGTMTTERRENVTLMPLAIFSNNEGSEIINGEVNEPELVGEEEVA